MGAYYLREETGFRISRGNAKLGDDTVSINPGPAIKCPSLFNHYCQLPDDCECYAIRDERLYKSVLPYRLMQEEYWQNHTADEMVKDFEWWLKRIRVKINWFRPLVASDIGSHEDLDKIDRIAFALKPWDIRSYTYTANPCENYSNLHFVIRGSGHDKCPNGMTRVIGKKEATPKGWYRCPGDCRKCHVCKLPKFRNVVFPNHAPKRRDDE